ncbi:hypothetical protein GIB67_015743 [Kingdonia uniflora]|uniref:Uncharacterized protein n=1 Tax=Kingdonia uniflora TaxID=39325 RepID=A0A7J7NUD1_9MAGN|nr:hypothetical protein GIB67_015743 [Kingdonia uniflora]
MRTEKKIKEMGHESTSKDLLEFDHKPDFMLSSLESKVHYDDMPIPWLTLAPIKQCKKRLEENSGVEVLSDRDEAFEEEEMKVDSKDESDDLIESDLEVLGEDVMEPDNDPP